MQRYGRTTAGRIRWYCPYCKLSTTRRHKDTRVRHLRRLFVAWLLGVKCLRSIAKELNVSRRTLTNRFKPLWDEPLPTPQPVSVAGKVLVVDGLVLNRGVSVLIGWTPSLVAHWVFAGGESTADWTVFTNTVTGTPSIVVLDGRAGLLAATQATWPTTKIQRCHFHVLKRARILLTMQPKTKAGQTIRRLLLDLKYVQTRRQRRRWIRTYRKWEHHYDQFLKERTISDQLTPTGKKRWWYTHKRLRGVRSLVCRALPHLFTYVRHPTIPKTTNHVEGGLNSPLVELIHRHRGLNPKRKQRLAALFLTSKQ